MGALIEIMGYVWVIAVVLLMIFDYSLTYRFALKRWLVCGFIVTVIALDILGLVVTLICVIVIISAIELWRRR